MKTIKLHYSEALIRKAFCAFYLRLIGWWGIFGMGFVVAFFIYLVASGDRSWAVGALGALMCVIGFAAVFFYVVHYRGAITRLRRMQSPQATFEAGDDRFRLTSDVGSNELSWSVVTEIWQFPEFWLLIFNNRAQYCTLPLADIDSDTREFILDRAKSHGAKIS